MKEFLSRVTLLVVLGIGLLARGQEKQTYSLLSNIGIGTISEESSIEERAQGGVNVVGNNSQEVSSVANPALLADLALTSFRIEGQGLSSNVELPNINYTSSAFSLSNVSISFPIGKIGGLNAGLRVYSTTGFEVSTPDFYNDGVGAVNQIYFGFGGKIFKGLSAGIQTSLFFGKITKRQVFKSFLKNSVNEDDYNVKGSSLKLGFRYEYDFNKNLKAQVGLYSIFKHTLQADGDNRFFEAIETKTSEEIFRQLPSGTVQENDISGSYESPLKNVLGFGLGKQGQWFAGTSLSLQDKVKISGDAFESTTSLENFKFEEHIKFSVGGYFTPKRYSLKNYLKRITYRAGFTYEQTGIVLNSNSLNNVGMSLGLGLPVGRRISYVNVSAQAGFLGDKAKNDYQETYVNIGVAFTLSDKWFKKRVID